MMAWMKRNFCNVKDYGYTGIVVIPNDTISYIILISKKSSNIQDIAVCFFKKIYFLN